MENYEQVEKSDCLLEYLYWEEVILQLYFSLKNKEYVLREGMIV